ncbi:MAG: FAD-dependent oxidoreductase, partial [Sphingobacteriaceae bacterium]|nr:FAD-dependent oxidoreductase [Sphingobacteriaceae bacterium]
MQRNIEIEKLQKNQNWNVIVIGGGATGLGIAIDAASRGYSTLLLEAVDFAKGTSSRSTKLVHGGVRYLEQGNISLVREALYERGLMLKNAAHLVKKQKFIIANYSWFNSFIYLIGLKIYDILAGKLSFGRSVFINKAETLKSLPTLQSKSLKNGVVYYDGQFDDARMAINMAQTASEYGACVLNYFKVTALQFDSNEKICGLNALDIETGKNYSIKGNTIINATGVFTDRILKLNNSDFNPSIVPSQGVHLVFDASFLPSSSALMIPKTS